MAPILIQYAGSWRNWQRDNGIHLFSIHKLYLRTARHHACKQRLLPLLLPPLTRPCARFAHHKAGLATPQHCPSTHPPHVPFDLSAALLRSARRPSCSATTRLLASAWQHTSTQRSSALKDTPSKTHACTSSRCTSIPAGPSPPKAVPGVASWMYRHAGLIVQRTRSTTLASQHPIHSLGVTLGTSAPPPSMGTRSIKPQTHRAH